MKVLEIITSIFTLISPAFTSLLSLNSTAMNQYNEFNNIYKHFLKTLKISPPSRRYMLYVYNYL